MSVLSRIASVFSTPAVRVRQSPEPQGRPIRATYDAARDGNETVNIWANSDALDADSANSLAVRTKLRKRDRYERANNGHKCGIHRTQANYVVGTGPKLKMGTASAGFNSMVEAAWNRWANAVQFARVLRQMNRAKTGDGEAIALLITDQAVGDIVKVTLRAVECDQLTAPIGTPTTERYLDGIHFDANGNPTAYDILDRHPGASWYQSIGTNYKTYEARFVCHWFLHERPGQHRGIPEGTSTLNLFPTARRFREATVASAETAADLSAAMEMGMAAGENDELVPFSTIPIEKRTFVVTPAGAHMTQMRAEHPATTYEMFNRETLCEEARPFNMPYNIAACDSSDYSYSGGQLDHQTYFQSVGIEQQECEMDVVDPTFAVWFAEARSQYGWTGEEGAIPKHSWGWPGKPHNDPVKTWNSRKTALSVGGITLGQVYSQDGEDYEDRILEMAVEFGVTPEEMKQRILDANFPKTVPPQVTPPPDEPDEPQRPNGRTARAARAAALYPQFIQGNGRHE